MTASLAAIQPVVIKQMCNMVQAMFNGMHNNNVDTSCHQRRTCSEAGVRLDGEGWRTSHTSMDTHVHPNSDESGNDYYSDNTLSSQPEFHESSENGNYHHQSPLTSPKYNINNANTVLHEGNPSNSTSSKTIYCAQPYTYKTPKSLSVPSIIGNRQNLATEDNMQTFIQVMRSNKKSIKIML